MNNPHPKDPMKEIVSQEYAAKLASSFAGLMRQMVHEEKATIVEGYLAVSQAITDLADKMDSNLNPLRLGFVFSRSRKRDINLKDASRGFAVNKVDVRLNFTTEILKDDILAEPLERLVESYGYEVSDNKALLDAVREDIAERFRVTNRFDRLPVDSAQKAKYAEDASHPIHALVQPKPAPDQGQGLTF